MIEFHENIQELGFDLPLSVTLLEPLTVIHSFPLNISLSQIREQVAKKQQSSEEHIGSTKKFIHPEIKVKHCEELPKTTVEKSSIHGFGLFAAKSIVQGETVIEYEGLKIDTLLNDLVEETYEKSGFESTYMFRMGESEHLLDATFVGNGARFANHSCSPNAESKYIGGKVYLIANRNIKIGEEIVYNYNMRRMKGMPRVDCYCGSENCNGFMDNAM